MITEAIDETMAEMDSRMETKVRKGYQQDNRVSPNIVYAKFVHRQTRPVDGIPDPHYHIHVLAMNATFDEVEKEWKALEVKVLQLWSRDLIGWLDAPAHGFGFGSFQVAAIRTRGHLAGGWLYLRFSQSYRDVEELVAERGTFGRPRHRLEVGAALHLRNS